MLFLYKWVYNSNNTINVTYQFNNVSLPTVTHYLDPIWGTVYRETVENGSDIIDTFDGDISVLLEKEFVNGNIVTSIAEVSCLTWLLSCSC